MNRLSRVLLAGLVMASSLIMPVGAWDKYSFVGDAVYFDQPLADAAHADSSTMSLSKVSNYDFFSLLSAEFDSIAAMIHVHHPEKPGGSVGSVELPDIPAWDEYRSVPASGSSFSIQNSTSGSYQFRRWITPSINLQQNLNGGKYEGIVGIVSPPYNLSEPNPSFRVSMDLSSFGDFTAFSLSGPVSVRCNIDSAYANRFDVVSFDILVNGALVRTFYPDTSGIYSGSIVFPDFVYSSSVPIQSIEFVAHMETGNYDVTSGTLDFLLQRTGSWADDLVFSVLSGDSILDGYVDNAQDSINDWDSIESEFGSDATEGFNGLDLDNFTYPSDFLAAFSLVSGIFMDLWNCMGDFQIIYLLPLTLGICLLLVGRVSRSSVPSPPPLHTDLPVSNSLGPPSRPALKGGKR